MRQHRAGEGKLLDLEGLKLAPQTLSTSDSDLFIARVWLACEIEVRRKVDHRGDAATVAFANLLQSLPNALVGGEVDFLECRRGGECFWGARSRPITLWESARPRGPSQSQQRKLAGKAWWAREGSNLQPDGYEPQLLKLHVASCNGRSLCNHSTILSCAISCGLTGDR
jgi:hypothetical protein